MFLLSLYKHLHDTCDVASWPAKPTVFILLSGHLQTRPWACLQPGEEKEAFSHCGTAACLGPCQDFPMQCCLFDPDHGFSSFINSGGDLDRSNGL